jgi:hypothetical protein
MSARGGMDAYDRKHLKTWLQQSVFSDDRRKVGKIIRSYVRRHPEVIGQSRSWPEILRLAEASGSNPRDVSALQKKREVRERAAQIRQARTGRAKRNPKITIGDHVKFHGHDGKDYAATVIGTKRGYFEISYYVPGTGTVKALVKKKDANARFNPAELLVMTANPRVEVVHADNPPVEDIVEDFTGQEVKWLDVYNEPHIPRGRYAQLGPLIALYIKPAKGGQVQRIGGMGENYAAAWAGKPPIIVTDSTARQIYFVDGAQDISANLAAFGAIDRGNGLVELGQGRRIDYQCRKEHVASPEEDLWKHDHGEENGTLPTVLFDTRSKRLLYEGGDYRIEGPWIRN